MILDVVIKAYPPECKNLVDIWTNYARYNFTGIDVITFVKKRPKNPRTNNRRIAGLPAQCVSYLRNDMVTHNPQLAEAADKSYLVTQKEGVSEVREIG